MLLGLAAPGRCRWLLYLFHWDTLVHFSLTYLNSEPKLERYPIYDRRVKVKFSRCNSLVIFVVNLFVLGPVVISLFRMNGN
jgi:hypothetical protein